MGMPVEADGEGGIVTTSEGAWLAILIALLIPFFVMVWFVICDVIK